jgi:hypothetical protein
MQPLTFMGALNVGLFNLPYQVPTGSFVTGYRWMPDSWSASDDIAGTTRTLRLLRQTAPVINVLANVGPSAPDGGQGSIWGAQALRDTLDGLNNAEACLYATPLTGGPYASDANAFIALSMAGAPAGGFGEQPAIVPLATQAGDVKFSLFGFDVAFANQYRLMTPSTFTPQQGWFPSVSDPNMPPNLQAYWPDRANQRNRSLNQGLNGLTNIIDFFVSADGSLLTQATIEEAPLTGNATVDMPQFQQPNQANGFYITADNSGGPAPVVPNGSPIFFFARDLSAYWEIVFSAAGPGVNPNDLGGYGPPWDYPFAPQITTDPDGNIYYMQDNAATPGFMDVYSGKPQGGGGAFGGTFVSFIIPNQLTGGNK